jgi:dipeptidyl aminopeptidase/acylaminoacyl peptidase
MRVGLSGACLVIMALCFTACGSPSRPPPGPIVFSGHPEGGLGDGFNNLMVMNPDGTGVRRLTRTDGDVAPSWSPDGTQVAFERATEIEGCDLGACAQIWIVDADGTDERRLTPPSARSEAPDWSPTTSHSSSGTPIRMRSTSSR